MSNRCLTLLILAASVACARVSGTPGEGDGGLQPGQDGASINDRMADRPASNELDLISSGTTDPDGGGVCQRELTAIVRDFRSGEKDGQPKHPDFEYMIATDPGIVAPMLGPDSKPVYAGGTRGTTTTQANFDQWYRDVPEVNIRFEKKIPLTADPARPGVYVYDSDAFYPLSNDEGWGNQNLDHNYDFTTEIHLSFPYKGGEILTFRGDDDVFIFVAGQLVVDLGGVHESLTGTVAMDEWAARLGLSVGQTYQMDVFQAERHCCESRFHLETTLSCIRNVVID